MASKQDIKKAILAVAGSPDSGVVVQLADAWADAIIALDEPAKVQVGASSEKADKEVRIVKAAETR